MLGALIVPLALAAPDQDASARLREMLHRTQEALRDAQAQNADLIKAKTEAEQKLQAASGRLETDRKTSAASQAALQTQLQAANDARVELEKKLGALQEQLSAARQKNVEGERQLTARESELTTTKQALEQSKGATASCEAKNMALYGYAQEVLQLYKHKGVWAAVAQKEPVLGFKEVEIENVVQEYQLKYDSERISH
jgi:DNA repair exonuclease SbcCD ATPase subunit